MYLFLTHLHSTLRYVVLLLLLISIINSVYGALKQKEFTKEAKRISYFTFISILLEVSLGFMIYFLSDKVIFDSNTFKMELYRFFTMEHPLMMIIAVGLISVGHLKAIRKNSVASYKTLIIYNLLGLLIIIAAIPWTFRQSLGAGWF